MYVCMYLFICLYIKKNSCIYFYHLVSHTYTSQFNLEPAQGLLPAPKSSSGPKLSGSMLNFRD